MMTDEELLEFLKANPTIKDKIKRLSEVTLNKDLKVSKGDDAEAAVVKYSRELNKELLQVWSQKEMSRLEGNVNEQVPDAKKHRTKKN
jgi:hypothetical protein